MAHGYKHLQHWNQWLSKEYLGGVILEAERAKLSALLQRHYGKHATLLGVPSQFALLQTTLIPFHSLITPVLAHDRQQGYVEGDWYDLPILTASADLVLLPHTLEFVDNPRQVLAEACRIVKPEGLIAICGFNPHSPWGMKKKWNKDHPHPWKGHPIYQQQIKKWLRLADFVLEEQTSTLYRPPLTRWHWFEKLYFLENLGQKILPNLGGIYILLARAKNIPLTPIKARWKQQFTGMGISTTISAHSAR